MKLKRVQYSFLAPYRPIIGLAAHDDQQHGDRFSKCWGGSIVKSGELYLVECFGLNVV